MQKLLLVSPVAQAIQAARYDLISHDTATIQTVFGSSIYLLIPIAIIAFILVTGILKFVKESKFFAENI